MEQNRKKNSGFEDFDRKESISFGHYLEESDRLLFADSYYDGEAGRRRSEIVLLDRKSGGRKRISAGGEGEGNPALSPDGRQVLFLSTLPGQGRQLFVYDLETEACRQVTTMRFGLTDPLWSPDGTKILFTSSGSDTMDEDWLQTPADPAEEARYRRERAKEPVVITDLGYKFDGLGFAQPEVMHLWVVEADGSAKARRITAGEANFMHGAWAPDSKHVLCESNLYCDKSIGIAMDLLYLDVETCEMSRVTRDKMVVSYPNPVRPVFTPDGKYIIIGILDYEGRKDLNGTYPSCTLYRVTPDGKELVPISEKTEECFDTVQFAYNAGCGAGLEKVRVSSDGRYVLFHACFRGECRIFKTPIYGEDHRPVALTKGKYAHNGMGVPKNGKVLLSQSETDVPESYVLLDENTGGTELLYQSNEDWLAEKALSRAEDFFFDCLDGRSLVHGFCLPPQNREPGKKYPCIVYVHGGPHPFYTYGFDLEMQAFAGNGFGVLFCNPRGSSGYGDEHRKIEYAFDGSAYTDIMQFVSEAVRRFDWIDGDRLGLTGGSYGGYMTNYAASRSKRFKAFIAQRSIGNELISYASGDMQGDSGAYPTFGEFMDHEVERSVICGMEKVDAPFLILHGVDDLRCPVEGAHQLFVAIKDSHPEDFPVKLVLYPRCAHNQPTHPGQLRHYYRAMLDWFKMYL